MLNEINRRISLKFFADYYENAEFAIPEIQKREFGIGNAKKIDARHLAFGTADAFRAYLLANTPLFVSHSISYYTYPGATPIQKKKREYADLVFDLDLHAEGKYGVYICLKKIKNDAIRLIEDFLIADFGIKRDEIIMVFSGNRGYHIHVRDEDFIRLGAEERKEIVGYVSGMGLDYRRFFEQEEIKKNVLRVTGPTPEESGYRGRFAREVVKQLEKDPKAIARDFQKEEELLRFIQGIKEGNWSKTRVKDIISKTAKVAETLPLSTIEPDAAVTHDLSKLIRVPNSIHGETGFIAKIVKDRDNFDPMKDALIKNNSAKNILFLEDVDEIEIADSLFGPFKKDEKKELPLPVAMFFVLKESAVFA